MFNVAASTSLEGFTLVIPSACVGNVSQLTCDLIIESLQMEKIADCFHAAIVPAIGAPAFSHIKDPITTAAELYQDLRTKLLVLQIRTPLAAPLMGDFFNQIVEFSKDKKIREVVILTSSYGYEKKVILGSNFWCKSSHFEVPESLPRFEDPKILGGGFGLKLFQRFEQAKIPALLMFNFVSEGDNIPDAVQMLQKLNEVRKMFDETQELKVKMPVSWKYLFGNAPPKGIY